MEHFSCSYNCTYLRFCSYNLLEQRWWCPRYFCSISFYQDLNKCERCTKLELFNIIDIVSVQLYYYKTHITNKHLKHTSDSRWVHSFALHIQTFATKAHNKRWSLAFPSIWIRYTAVVLILLVTDSQNIAMYYNSHLPTAALFFTMPWNIAGTYYSCTRLVLLASRAGEM